MRIAPFPARLSLAAILTLAISTTSTSAQQKTAAPPAPVPAQILSARKVFIANGAGETPIGSPFGDSDPTYDEFYAGVKSWNRYTLTAGPGDADLVLQVSCIWHSERGHSALVSYDEFLRLIVIDPKTGIRLWGLGRARRDCQSEADRAKELRERDDQTPRRC